MTYIQVNVFVAKEVVNFVINIRPFFTYQQCVFLANTIKKFKLFLANFARGHAHRELIRSAGPIEILVNFWDRHFFLPQF